MTTSGEPARTAPDAKSGVESASHPAQTTTTTSIVVPAYNETHNLRPLVAEIRAALDSEVAEPYRPFEIVLVDDGSTDGSREVMGALATEYPEVHAVLLRRNFGQSAALAAGIHTATGEFVVTMDADRQNDPADAVSLLSELTAGEYDCVSGWRRDRNDPVSKTLPSAIQTRLARLTGPDIHDFGCTLKAYRADALAGISIYGEGHRYIPAKLYKRGYRITERPVTHRPRTAGETKYGVKRLFKGFFDLLFHLFWNRYSTRPLHFLGGAGSVLMAAGMVIGAHAVVQKYVFGVHLVPRTPRLILTATLVLFGFQLLMFGFLAEIMIKHHYQSNRPYRIETIYE